MDTVSKPGHAAARKRLKQDLHRTNQRGGITAITSFVRYLRAGHEGC